MAMEVNGSYTGYAQYGAAAGRTQQDARNNKTEHVQEAYKADRAAGGSKTDASGGKESADEYVKSLAKLVPSVEFRVGNSYASDKTGKTLTVDPRLIEKMKKDPEKEKEMLELIKGVESMTKLSERLNKATGWTTVFRHSYIDENGEYRHIALIRNDFMLNMSDELREERQKNAQKLLEKQRENAAKKKEELEELSEEKKEPKADKETDVKTEEKPGVSSDPSRAEQIIKNKAADSEGGMIYMDDAEFRTLIDAMKEEDAGNKYTADANGQAMIGANRQTPVGSNLDMQI